LDPCIQYSPRRLPVFAPNIRGSTGYEQREKLNVLTRRSRLEGLEERRSTEEAVD